jgi:pimeloyl-ACP methyl ester carboxylesterase
VTRAVRPLRAVARSTSRQEGEMTMSTFLTAVVAAGMTMAAYAPASAETRTAPKTGYAKVNGLNLYYEIHGSGEPMVLLHGGLGASSMFGEILPLLSKTRQVIAVDLQGHGRTADINRPLTFEAMADDVASLIRYLKIGKADVMGYSLGGGVALRTAAQHPDVVKKLVLVSVAFKRDGWYPEIREGMSQVSAAAAEPMKQTPMYRLYSSVAPKPDDWPVLLSKIGELLKKDYDWSRDVAGIQVPTLLVFGDADAVPAAHVAQFFELLGGGKKDGGWDGSGISSARLATLPGLTHYTVFSSPLLASTVSAFLEGPVSGSR